MADVDYLRANYEPILTLLQELQLGETLDQILESIAGVNFTNDTMALLRGSYATYITYGRGAIFETIGLPVEVGMVMAPDNPLTASLTVATITDMLRDNYGLPIIDLTPTSYMIDMPEGTPDIVYGLQSARTYISTPTGADRIIEALQGRNLTSDPRWLNALELAPEGTQYVTYFNVNAFIALTDTFLRSVPELNTPEIASLITYLERFESITIFGRYSTETASVIKLALRLSQE